MVSVNTFSTNKAVLASLRQTNADLATTQSRIASGLKIASAKDNSTLFATAQSIRADIASSDVVDGSIAIAKGRADAAYEALTTIQDLLGKISTAATGLTNTNTGGKNVQIQADLELYRAQIMAVAKSAAIQGTNLVTAATATSVSATVGQDNGTPITLAFSTEQIVNETGATTGLLTTGAATANTNILGFDFDAASVTADINAFTSAVTAAATSLTAYTTRVGNYADSLGKQQDFFAKIKDIRTTALGAIVDANMEEESAKVQALQVKQQLAFQALSIGNSSSQNILRLFQ